MRLLFGLSQLLYTLWLKTSAYSNGVGIHHLFNCYTNTNAIQYNIIERNIMHVNRIPIACNSVQYLVSFTHHVVVQDIAKILH